MKKLLGFVVLGLLNVLKVIVIMVMELTHTQMEANTLENIKTAKYTDKELTRGQMETNMLGNLKTLNETA